MEMADKIPIAEYTYPPSKLELVLCSTETTVVACFLVRYVYL